MPILISFFGIANWLVLKSQMRLLIAQLQTPSWKLKFSKKHVFNLVSRGRFLWFYSLISLSAIAHPGHCNRSTSNIVVSYLTLLWLFFHSEILLQTAQRRRIGYMWWVYSKLPTLTKHIYIVNGSDDVIQQSFQ